MLDTSPTVKKNRTPPGAGYLVFLTPRQQPQMPYPEVDDILARFPGPISLPASPYRWLPILAGSGFFVAVGLFDLKMGIDPVVGWLCITFFVCGAVVSAFNLLPGSASLTLYPNGLEVKRFYRRRRISWTAISDFRVATVGTGQKLVVYNSVNFHGAMSIINRALTGRNSWMPDTYGMIADDLVRLLATWRERALTDTGLVEHVR